MTATPIRDQLTNGLFRHFCLICAAFMLLVSSIVSPSLTSTANAQALNLGTIIQKNTKGAPPPRSYIKLPKTLTAPKSNPFKNKTADQGTQSAQPAPGQIAPVTDPAAAQQTATERPSRAMQPETQEPEQAAAPAEPPKPTGPKIEPGGIAKLQLTAFLTDQGQVLQRGVNWRIFEEKQDSANRMPLIHNSDGGTLSVDLNPGSYIIYAGYGYANLTKRVILSKAGDYEETFNLQAGAIKLNAIASGDVPLDQSLLRFSVYARDTSASDAQELIAKDIKADHVIKMSEGTYHIVSSYGTSNAKVRGDVEVKAGKLITVTMMHHAAKVTLRLVSEPGGEALANTVWTVLTPGGDVVKRAIGAFPTLALAAGDYTAIAKQNNEVYNRDFSVNSGIDRDIEVLAKVR